jgi:hypothetical protein
MIARVMIFVLGVASPAAAAAGAQLPSDARLDPVRAALQAELDGAAARGLPDALLADKVREGLAKQIAPARIAQVVHKLAGDLAAARDEAQQHVQGAPPPALLKAIVDAHALGAQPADVQRVLGAARTAATQALAVETLADLLQRRFPANLAARAVSETALRRPGALAELPARAESLVTARAATRAEAMQTIERNAGFDSPGHRLGDDGRGPNRETSGPRHNEDVHHDRP